MAEVMMNKVLYIGGFEMPDGNAAAQRVLGVAKLMRECGCSVQFLGLSRRKSGKGEIDGFIYENLPYPQSFFSWLSYLTGGSAFVKAIETISPDIVVFYNHPALAIEKLNKWCRLHNVKTLADITEWYEPQGNPVFKIIKGYDTKRRMRYSHFQLDGLISISRYLDDYYASRTDIPQLLLPPLVDLEQTKWGQVYEECPLIKIVYAGSPGSTKDRLDLIINALSDAKTNSEFVFRVIGITEEQYRTTWHQNKIPSFVDFKGRISHEEVIRELLGADFQLFLRPDNLSNRAGFPTKFVETVASHTLPITNINANLTDYFDNGVNGFVINSLELADVKEVLTKVLSLSKDEIVDIRSKMDNSIFDYRRFIPEFKSFISKI